MNPILWSRETEKASAGRPPMSRLRPGCLNSSSGLGFRKLGFRVLCLGFRGFGFKV